MQSFPHFLNPFILAAAQSPTTPSLLSVHFLKTIIIINSIVSFMDFYHHNLVARNTTAKFKAQNKNWGMGREKEIVQPTCMRWQPLQRCRASPAICSMVCEGCMKGRNGRRVSPCQSYLGEKCWKNTIFHTAISGGWRENGENKTEDEKVWGWIKKRRMDGWLSRVRLIIFFHLWVLKVLLGQKYSQDIVLKIAFGLIVQLRFIQ